MKNKTIALFTFLFSTLLLLCLATAGITWKCECSNVCEAYDMYDTLTPEIIQLYEEEIAGEQIVSNKSQERLERLAQTLGISLSKTKAVLLLQDFASRTGESMSLSALAKMNDMKLISFAKQRASVYLSGLTPERKEYLSNKLKGIL